MGVFRLHFISKPLCQNGKGTKFSNPVLKVFYHTGMNIKTVRRNFNHLAILTMFPKYLMRTAAEKKINS